MKLEPQFDTELLAPDVMRNHFQELITRLAPLDHIYILKELLSQIKPINFKELALLDEEESELSARHFLVLTIENLLKIAEKNQWGICKNNNYIYLYNGTFWSEVDKEIFQKFLGEAAEKMGVRKFFARYYQFKEKLFKQFLSSSYLSPPEPDKNKVLINFKNGTFEITPTGTRIRDFDRADFLTYILPFKYTPEAEAPIFQRYLNRVLPDVSKQQVIAEFLGYVFLKNGGKALKEEKALILYGSGANGKSVFFEVVNALLGTANVSGYSLQSLTDVNGYYRAKLANKLLNYATEINGKLESSFFKQLVSGEPIEARLPYFEPFMLRDYAKFIFNCNVLPIEVEQTEAYFRRFLIILFDVQIPECEQDKELHTKIIQNELAGVFNWVLDGLKRLLKNKKFSDCLAAKLALDQYKLNSDSVKLFLNENDYQAATSGYVLIKLLYLDYRSFCNDDGFRPVNKSNFIKRLQNKNIVIERRNIGNVAYISKTTEM